MLARAFADGEVLKFRRAGAANRHAQFLGGFFRPDFRIGREFKIVERMRLALVGEAFNLFNHTEVTSVGPGSPPNVYNYTAAGSGVCAGHTNGCIVPNPTFPAVSQTTTPILGPRQLQISGRLTF